MFTCCGLGSFNFNGLHEECQVLTTSGYKSIIDVDVDEGVWNGFEVVTLKVKTLPKPVKMMCVEFNNYVKIRCVPTQVFPIVEDSDSCQHSLIQADQLQPGMKLMYPNHLSFPFCSSENFTHTYAEWLYAMMNRDGDIIKKDLNSILKLRLKLQSLGLDSNISVYGNKYRLQFTQKARQKLMRLEVDCPDVWFEQELTNPTITVESVTPDIELSTVYTFSDNLHRTHMLVNGLMIGSNCSL